MSAGTAPRVAPTPRAALLIAVDVVLLRANPGPVALFVMLGALGVYYAATHGILATMALTAFAASTVFGAIWSWQGPNFAVGVFLAGLVVALVLSIVLLRPLLLGRTEDAMAG
jgi:hypothetical protein